MQMRSLLLVVTRVPLLINRAPKRRRKTRSDFLAVGEEEKLGLFWCFWQEREEEKQRLHEELQSEHERLRKELQAEKERKLTEASKQSKSTDAAPKRSKSESC